MRHPMSDLGVLRKFHKLLRPFIVIFMVSILFDIVATLLGLSMPLFTRVLFDYAYPYKDLALLNTTIIAIIITYFLYFFLNVSSEYLHVYVNQELTVDLTKKVYNAIQRLPLKFHQEKKSGDLLIRITDDVANTVAMVMNVLPTIIIDGGRLLVILLIALSINTKLTLLALISIPLYILEAKFYASRLAGVEQEAVDADSNIYTRAQERLSNIKTIKAYAQEDRETISFGKLLRKRYRIAVKGRILEVAQTFTNSITLQMWTVFLTWFLGYQVVKGQLSIGEIVALMLYFEQLGEPIRAFIDLFTEWKTNMVSMSRLREVIDEPAEDDETDGDGEKLDISDGNIHAVDLSFAYAPDEDILHDIDVSFPPHSVTAIVGSSGSGKTTLVNLLLRFFKPTQGMILVDGQNISEVRVNELRGSIGMVMQDASLFDGTVVDNILYGNEGKSRGDAMQAAQLAGADDFITKMTGGYDSPVGVSGELLSGGQRQRLVIARTLLRNPSIIIFDEATSSLDAESEYRIQETIFKLRKSKTVIVIAHRLSTIKSADNIMVLEDGHFVEEGQFDSLLNLKGPFYRYYWRQFGGLATFRQQLALEFERSSRYGSKFSIALLKISTYKAIDEHEGSLAAEQFMDGFDFFIRKQIRMGDNCARLGKETVLLLLPEIDVDQLKQFFSRMRNIIVTESEPETSRPLRDSDIFFVGTVITKKAMRTPEELISALDMLSIEAISQNEFIIIDEDNLAEQTTEGEKT
jgi:ABC-type bacteriocin/lantibiotic exporter with double-glycine peptidase domain